MPVHTVRKMLKCCWPEDTAGLMQQPASAVRYSFRNTAVINHFHRKAKY